MDDQQPSCSRPKRQKFSIKNQEKLTQEELEYFLTHSSDDEEIFSGDDNDYSHESESGKLTFITVCTYMFSRYIILNFL